MANPPNSAQLKGTPTTPPTYVRVHAVVWKCGDGQSKRQTDIQMVVGNIHFTSAMPHAKCNEMRRNEMRYCITLMYLFS